MCFNNTKSQYHALAVQHYSLHSFKFDRKSEVCVERQQLTFQLFVMVCRGWRPKLVNKMNKSDSFGYDKRVHVRKA